MVKRILWLLLLLPALSMAQSAQGPYGVFGGPLASGKLPPAANVPTNTLAFTTDQGLMIVNNGAWLQLSGGIHFPGGGGGGQGTNFVATTATSNGTVTSQIIDTTVHTAQILSSADSGNPNIIGQSFSSGTLASLVTIPSDTYTAGTANYATIACGYDNVDNSIAGEICGDHNRAYTAATHPIMIGNINYISSSGDSNMILGLQHAITGAGNDNAIFGGEEGTIEGGTGLSTILGGASNTINTSNGNESLIGVTSGSITGGQYATAVGGYQPSISGSGTYLTIVGGQGNTISSTSNANSIVGGQSNTISGSAQGAATIGCTGCTITTGANYALAFGNGTQPFTSGFFWTTYQHSAAGDSMAVTLECGITQVTTAVGYCSTYGSSNYITKTSNTMWVGVVTVSGRESGSTNRCAWYGTFTINVTSGGTESIDQQTWTALYNPASICTQPTWDVTTNSSLILLDLAGTSSSGTMGWTARVDMVTNTY